ncbi:AraC family transcriptional regulator [Streptomyces sp. NPDC050263]|uniref:AraC family transcriptional regulator n=1 Tax=Streptomyces sp. NPDC050263 TaxID=3155037 RepID=UPI00343B0FFF
MGTRQGSGDGWARYWRDGSRPLEAMHAHFFEHLYPLHSHDTYSFGITDVGAQTFRCRGAAHTSGAGMVMAFNPDEVHDGRAAADLGYQYRIVHIGPSIVRDTLADAGGAGGAGGVGGVGDGRGSRGGGMPLFVRPVLDDPTLTVALTRLHAALVDRSRRTTRLTRLRQEELLVDAVLAMAERGATRAPRVRTLAGRAQRQAAGRARALLNDAFLEPLSANDLAAAAGCSRFALYRAFREAYGVPPSDYQRLLRLRHARRLLTGGPAPAVAAVAAVAAGFSDQAHLHRWFKRVYGITPGTFLRAVG